MIPDNSDSTLPPESVTLVGAGAMGQAIGRVLLDARHPLTVWNRTQDHATPLTDRGAVLASSAAEAMEASELILMCLGNQQHVSAVLDQVPPGSVGGTLINLTTASPQEVPALVERASSMGVDLLVGAMMAVPAAVGSQDALFLYSGSAAAFERHAGTLSLLADNHYLGETFGSAPLWDLALLGAGYSTLAGFIHSAALLDTANVRAGVFLPLARKWLTGMLAFLEDLAGEIDERDFGDGVSTVALNQHAVQSLISTSARLGVDPAVHYPVQQLLDRRVLQGRGADSFSSLFMEMKSRSSSA